jgi:hypothetical protein
MTRIESEQVTVSKSPSEVFAFLADFNNYRQLMPEQVTDWESDTDTCSFNIKGMASLGMAIENRTPDSEIRIRKTERPRLIFFLRVKSENPTLLIKVS